jgi:sensor domain CHASE-containing protein
MKTVSDFVPTLIVIVVVVLLATWVVRESAKSQAERRRQTNATLEAIRKQIGNEELWQKANQSLNSPKDNLQQ